RQELSLFRDGQYLPLTIQGSLSKHLIAFARKSEQTEAIVVVPRFCAQLLAQNKNLHGDLWMDTYVELPDTLSGKRYTNLLSQAVCSVNKAESGARAIKVADLFQDFPWALLTTTS